MLNDPLEVVKKATRIFESAGMDYLVGGSLASSLYGIPRATQGVDILVNMTESNLEAVLPSLREHFYIDEPAAKDAVRKGASFNIIDREYLYKLDIFVQGADDLSQKEMRRRINFHLAGPGDQTIFLGSPEDIIAHKLYWYRLGNEVSERQWNDALNVIKVQRNKLDYDYLKLMCEARGVSGLLKRLLEP